MREDIPIVVRKRIPFYALKLLLVLAGVCAKLNGQAAAPPTLGSLSPTSVGWGQSSVVLTVTGTGFNVGTVLDWTSPGGTVQTALSQLPGGSGTQLQFVIPAGYIDPNGTANVRVRNGGLASGTLPFNINLPSISSLS